MRYFQKSIVGQPFLQQLRITIDCVHERWRDFPDGIKTIGSPSYKYDIIQSDEVINEENRWLWSHFGSMYELIMTELSEYVSSRIYIDPQVPLPGFHIFKEI